MAPYSMKRVSKEGLLELISSGDTHCQVLCDCCGKSYSIPDLSKCEVTNTPDTIFYSIIAIDVANGWICKGPYTKQQECVDAAVETLRSVEPHCLSPFYEGCDKWCSGDVPYLDFSIQIKGDSGSVETHSMRVTFVRERNVAVRAKLPGPT